MSPKATRIIEVENIDEHRPWCFFNGSSQGQPPVGGAGSALISMIKYVINLLQGWVSTQTMM